MKNCQIITTCELYWRQRLVWKCGHGGAENALLDNEWIFKLKIEESNLLLELESWHFSSGFMRWDIAGPLKYSWLSSVQNKADQTDNENPIKAQYFLYWQYKYINIIQYTYKIIKDI